MSRATNCLLIHPEFSKNSSLNYVDVCKIVGAKYSIPPLGLLTVAALLPQSWNFKLIDTNVEPLLDEHFDWADLVCTGGMLAQQTGILSVINKAHHQGKKVVVGGPDPSTQPKLYADTDYLVIGEGENTLPYFVNDFENGKTNGLYQASGLVDMLVPVLPRYDLIRFSDYLMMGMQFSRGCPYNCEFCNVIELFGRKQRAKTVSQILTELQCLFELGYRGHIFFIDDNFLANGRQVEELLIAIAGWSEKNSYPFYFQAEASINFAGSDHLLQLMSDADFRYLSIGIETPVDEILIKAQKRQNANTLIPDTVKKIFSYGILVDASFILGFDNESDQTASALVHCIQDSGICMAMVGTLFALPDTQLYERLKKEGRLFSEGTAIMDSSVEIDQMTSGLNFITTRPRSSILQDYITILEQIYDPKNYYQRLMFVGLNLKPNNKYRPDFSRKLRMTLAFLRICAKVGFNNKTGALFWRLIFKVLVVNPKALEPVVGFAAMYIHLAKHAQFIINLTRQKIASIEKQGEFHYNHSMHG